MFVGINNTISIIAKQSKCPSIDPFSPTPHTHFATAAILNINIQLYGLNCHQSASCLLPMAGGGLDTIISVSVGQLMISADKAHHPLQRIIITIHILILQQGSSGWMADGFTPTGSIIVISHKPHEY